MVGISLTVGGLIRSLLFSRAFFCEKQTNGTMNAVVKLSVKNFMKYKLTNILYESEQNH
jgi:hypothetical protein